MAVKNGELCSRTLPVSALTETEIDQMWSLFGDYYADVTRERFLQDLRNKQYLILLLDRGDSSVQGFSTIQVFEREVLGKNFISVYSGDTLIHRDYWGQTALQKAFFVFLMKLKLKNPLTTVWWFLISKGYKTYMLMARGCPEYWPRHDKATPAWPAAVINALATEKFGDDWKPALGVIQFADPAGRLKEGVAPIYQDLLNVDEIRYFNERNPGHAKGDELCCVGRIDAKLAAYYIGKLSVKMWRRYSRRLKHTLQPLPASAE